MSAEVRASGYLRNRGLTYRHFLSLATSFSEKKGEKKGGRQFRLWSLINHEPGRAFFLWWATISLMALDASQIENRMPCFSRKMTVGKGLAWGDASPTRGIAPGSRRDSPRDTDRAISRRAARVAFGECAWDKEIPRSSWIPGSRGARRRGRLSAWLRP